MRPVLGGDVFESSPSSRKNDQYKRNYFEIVRAIFGHPLPLSLHLTGCLGNVVWHCCRRGLFFPERGKMGRGCATLHDQYRFKMAAILGSSEAGSLGA